MRDPLRCVARVLRAVGVHLTELHLQLPGDELGVAMKWQDFVAEVLETNLDPDELIEAAEVVRVAQSAVTARGHACVFWPGLAAQVKRDAEVLRGA